jgi:hypothetical protein
MATRAKSADLLSRSPFLISESKRPRFNPVQSRPARSHSARTRAANPPWVSSGKIKRCPPAPSGSTPGSRALVQPRSGNPHSIHCPPLLRKPGRHSSQSPRSAKSPIDKVAVSPVSITRDCSHAFSKLPDNRQTIRSLQIANSLGRRGDRRAVNRPAPPLPESSRSGLLQARQSQVSPASQKTTQIFLFMPPRQGGTTICFALVPMD